MSRWTPRDAALNIVEQLVKTGHVAYFAGGCVRDRLLGRDPKDYDVATDATPKVVQRLYKRSQGVGAAFGVVLVYHGHGEERVTTEVATFRSDGVYRDGRRPDAVTFTDARHDAQRRDFTINGLFEDPLHGRRPNPDADQDGVIDFVGGRGDLKARVIRAIGDPEHRFAEDYLRMLRAVRFATRFGFLIEPATADAVRGHAPKLIQIARERIGDEVRRTLTGPRPADAVQLWFDLGLDEAVLGNRTARVATDEIAGLDPAADYATRLTAWLDARQTQISPVSARDRLALSNDEFVAFQQTASLYKQQAFLLKGSVADRKKIFSHPRWTQAMLRVRATASAEQVARIDTEVAELSSDGIGLAPPPLLDGDALIAAGLTPGPMFKRLLGAVYDAQLEGRVTTTGGALALALQLQREGA